MVTFIVEHTLKDHTGTDYKLSFRDTDSFRDTEHPKVEIPKGWAGNLGLAVGLVLIKNRDIAIECGLPSTLIDGCQHIGVCGAFLLGDMLIKAEGLKFHYLGLNRNDTFDLSLNINFTSVERNRELSKFL